MKKYLIIITSIFIISASILLGCTEKGTYPRGGKDTVKEFGDRRFVILRGAHVNSDSDDVKDNVKYWVFYDRKDICGIDNDVDIYKDIKPFAYVIGKNGYTKVNYENGEALQSMTLDSFNSDDIEIFKKMDIEKKDIKK